MTAFRGSARLPTLSRWVRLAILAWIAIPVALCVRIVFDKLPGWNVTQPGLNSTQPGIGKEVRLGGNPAQPSGLRTQSCFTSSCHGSLTPDLHEDAIRADEYFVWQNDPHARAHQTLFGARSTAIFQRLGLTDDQLQPLTGQADRFQTAWTNCLACHETNRHLAALSSETELPRVSLLKIVDRDPEGVSCESCHGDARGWLHRHYRTDWKTLGNDHQQELGYIPGDNVAARVKRCATCHVGSNAGDVNHDLIAAGHPALRFEYVWYSSRLPRHWMSGRRAAVAQGVGQHTGKDSAMAPADPTRDWLIGQLVTAIAALEQLERRAAESETNGSWPELSEYNCFACHHDLKRDSWRRERGIPGLAATGSKKSRLVVPWGNWNLELIQTIADQFGTEESQSFSTSFGQLRDTFRDHLGPANPQFTIHSRTAREGIKKWLAGVEKLPDHEAAQVLNRLGESQSERLISSWDQTAGALLGFAAPYHSANTIPEPLQTAMDRVRFPDDLVDDVRVPVDSPRDFRSGRDGQSLTEDEWIALLMQLAELKRVNDK